MSNTDWLKEQPEDGPHRFLNALVGAWQGTARTWFQPDELADESSISGTIRAALGGRFVIHEYQGSLQGKPLAGLAIHGYHNDFQRFETAWVDSFHMGTGNMMSVGESGATSANANGAREASVLGHYSLPAPGSPTWGWRTTLGMPDRDHLIITHYNITPEGQEARAVEIAYTRVS
jgi:hypothetical protein